MALKLDNSLLEELGLGALPDPEKQLLLRQIYEKLEMNVGMRLADQMSNEQLDAFEQFVDANDDKGAFKWLESNFPNYKDVVNQEFEKLKAEIRSVAPQILASAQQNAAAQQAMPQNTQPPQAAQSGMPPQYGPISPQPGQYGGGGQYGAAPDPNPASGQPPQQYAAPAQPPYTGQPQYGAPQAPSLDQYQQGLQPPQGQYPQYPPPQPPATPPVPPQQ